MGPYPWMNLGLGYPAQTEVTLPLESSGGTLTPAMFLIVGIVVVSLAILNMAMADEECRRDRATVRHDRER